MGNIIYIDIGSRTSKAFIVSHGKLEHLDSITIYFAEDYTQKLGITHIKKKLLFNFVIDIQKKNPKSLIKVFSTAFFRKLSQTQQKAFINEFLLATGLHLQIISQDLESSYLTKALLHKYFNHETVLVINIGGSSTELVVLEEKKVREHININFGIHDINNHFPGINNTFSSHALVSVTAFVKNRLPVIRKSIPYAFNTGSELLYAKLLRYPLVRNTIFQDDDHAFMMKVKNYASKNKEVFESISLHELELLMPENPQRMHGARASSAMAQAIFEQYNVQFIIPSDVDIAHGIFQDDRESINQ